MWHPTIIRKTNSKFIICPYKSTTRVLSWVSLYTYCWIGNNHVSLSISYTLCPVLAKPIIIYRLSFVKNAWLVQLSSCWSCCILAFFLLQSFLQCFVDIVFLSRLTNNSKKCASGGYPCIEKTFSCFLCLNFWDDSWLYAGNVAWVKQCLISWMKS